MMAVFNKWLYSTSRVRLQQVARSVFPIKSREHLPSLPLEIVDENEEPQSRQSPWPVISIRENLEKARLVDKQSSTEKLCIYRVPHNLREDYDKVYMPQIVSLGPYHHRKSHLCHMEIHKWRCLDHILKRTNHDVKIYLDAMKKLEETARDCYEGSISLSSDEFVEMMVLDGCFVLELFQGAVEGFLGLGYRKNDPIFGVRGTMHSIQRDMIMLENQIPLFILDRLFGLQIGDPNQSGMVEKIAFLFFDPLMLNDEPLTEDKINQLNSSSRSLHCLDVFRRSLLRGRTKSELRMEKERPPYRSRMADKRRQQVIHCVTELSEAGIKFERRITDRFWEIKFQNGVLRIPPLLINDGTKSLFLNLMAFERCHPDCNDLITSYVVFMDNLINSHEDVGYLHKCGIIEHWLGSDKEVAELFNRLCQEVVFDVNDSFFCGLSQEVNRYYNIKWNRWRANLKRNHFSDPWAIMSLIGAVILLLLTAAQTFFGYKAY